MGLVELCGEIGYHNFWSTLIVRKDKRFEMLPVNWSDFQQVESAFYQNYLETTSRSSFTFTVHEKIGHVIFLS